MAGQKPPMQLLIQAVDAHGIRIPSLAPLISEEFVVGCLVLCDSLQLLMLCIAVAYMGIAVMN